MELQGGKKNKEERGRKKKDWTVKRQKI